ncbi:MAG TPA: VOC family protein [Povalibacter sp.]|nr:VOC family protein [Povalibacter sp.]
MTATNRSMPASTVIPVLGYPDVRAAVDWLCRAFGFTERLRIGEHRSQLTFDGGSIVVTGHAQSAPAGNSHSVMVRVDDATAHYERAKQSGARVSGPPVDYPYGERQYSAIDPGGHVWTFSETIADSDPATWGGQLFEQD